MATIRNRKTPFLIRTYDLPERYTKGPVKVLTPEWKFREIFIRTLDNKIAVTHFKEQKDSNGEIVAVSMSTRSNPYEKKFKNQLSPPRFRFEKLSKPNMNALKMQSEPNNDENVPSLNATQMMHPPPNWKEHSKLIQRRKEKESDDVILKCPFKNCHEKFKNNLELQLHEISYHFQKKYSFEICQITFTESCKFKRHNDLKHNELKGSNLMTAQIYEQQNVQDEKKPCSVVCDPSSNKIYVYQIVKPIPRRFNPNGNNNTFPIQRCRRSAFVPVLPLYIAHAFSLCHLMNRVECNKLFDIIVSRQEFVRSSWAAISPVETVPFDIEMSSPSSNFQAS